MNVDLFFWGFSAGSCIVARAIHFKTPTAFFRCPHGSLESFTDGTAHPG
jgi:hypothetical protein